MTGPVRVEGGDCQELQRLLTVAGIEGLEVRDEAGYLVAAAQRLRLAYGEVSERKRLPLRWSVEVLRSHAEVPDETGYVVERHRSNEAGRRILFRPGTLLYLWHCDVL